MIFGRPDTFAIEVRALGAGPKGEPPICAGTWTEMRMVVQDRDLFSNVERSTGTFSQAIKWPSIYLASWFVTSWNEIFHTRAWPKPNTYRNARDVAVFLDEDLLEPDEASDADVDLRDEFVRRHSLRAAAAGAAMPDVWLSRDGDIVSVAWEDSMEGDVSFILSRGEADIPATDFAEAIRGFVRWVRDLLANIDDGQAHNERERFTKWLEEYESRSGALAGLRHGTGLSDERLSAIMELADVADEKDLFVLDDSWFEAGTLADVRASPIAVAFRCVAPKVDDADLVDLRRTILSVRRNQHGFSELGAMARRVPVPSSAYDFVCGYQLARGLRAALNNSADPLDIDLLVQGLGIPVKELRLSDESVDGGCVCDDSHGPLIFVNSSSRRSSTSWGRKLVLAHELCHLLFDRREALGLGIMSGPWAPPRVERVANAFAIELLLPVAGVLDTLGPVWNDPQDSDLKILMAKFGLGMTAVTEHVGNMRRRVNR